MNRSSPLQRPECRVFYAGGLRRAVSILSLLPVLLMAPAPDANATSLDARATDPPAKEAPGPMLAAAPDEKLKRCRYLHRRIEHFTRLRRSGGNSAQMERWRRSRQRFEEEYRLKRCYRFGRKLAELR